MIPASTTLAAPAAAGGADLRAHELRDCADRGGLFRQACRALRTGGRMILVEHHRGMPKLLAFGPGAGHVCARQEWEQAAAQAGLRVVARQRLTPMAAAAAFGAKQQGSPPAAGWRSREGRRVLCVNIAGRS